MWCSKIALFASAIILFCITYAQSRVLYNPQYPTPHGIRLAELTGDGLYDFYVVDGDKIYITNTDFTVRGRAYAKLPAVTSRTITGRFDGGTKDILCAQEPSLGRLDCYVLSPANDALWWYWYQGDFIGNSLPIVGDFNGDGRDDILVYTPATGTFQMYVRNPSTWFFEVLTNFNPGNLGSGVLLNLQVRAGKFGSNDARHDLIFYNPSNGLAQVYASVFDGTYNTFWWAFTSATGWGFPNEELLVADLNGDGEDDVILHNTVSGGYYFSWSRFHATASFIPMTTVSIGQLHTGANSRTFFAKLKNTLASEDAGRSNIRDDAIVFSYDMNMWIRSDARHDGATQTYWWAYTQYPILLNSDQDGDAIKTKHELGGYDPNNDGVSDTPLHTYGASPFFKDIFVEADYMAGPPASTYNFTMIPSAVSAVVAEFAKKNINMHIFIGNQVAYQVNIGGNPFDWGASFDPIKNANFAAARVPFFHYCLFANQYGGSGSSGLSRGIPGSDFIVSLGSGFGVGYHNNHAWQTGTFIHELGHNLGLRHGGPDHVAYKPNFLSVMNYHYQASGIFKDGSYQYLYSDITCNNLNEAALNENTGVACATGSSTYWTRVTCGVWDQVNTNYDWDGDLSIDAGTVSVDINACGSNPPGISTLVGGNNEYAALVFNGGSIGSAAKREAGFPDELTDAHIVEEHLREPNATEIPAPPTLPIDFSSLKPHDGKQFLVNTKNYPDIIKGKAQAVEIKPFGYPTPDRVSSATNRPQKNTETTVRVSASPVVPAQAQPVGEVNRAAFRA